ncbi:glycosyltransferase family 4 protein [Macrococcoides canis]|uniref:glycosyltransferase family 4 protein n=1 Tax=Macrococcoides canis TaxID=1855823 RepID=UPI001F1C7D68|nr:glycosyltransferase family 4 protein [Macrococcus canis]UJS28613.1 glycosyltransferase family 4 protein [Macrococcus canis]
MKRILLISQNFYPEIGSAANRMKNIFNHLEEQGYDVYILTTQPSYPNEKMYKDKKYWNDPFINGISENKVIRLSMRHEKQKKSMSSRLYYYIEFMLKVHYFVRNTEEHFDLIYVTSPNIFAPWGTLFLQKDSATDKTILEIRDLWPDSVTALDKINIDIFMPMLKLMEKRMYQNAKKIVVNNMSFIPHINKYVKNKDFLFLPNAINNEELNFRPKKETFSVVYTGNLGFAQDNTQLEEIAVELNRLKIPFNAIVYGVHANEFRQFVNDQQLKYVHVYETLPKSECLSFTSEHHIALSILKQSEVFMNVLPGKVIDALCMEVPVVTNLGGFTKELIQDYEVGIDIESATTEKLIEAILEYRNNPALLRNHTENTKKIRSEIFMWETNIHRLIDFIS